MTQKPIYQDIIPDSQEQQKQKLAQAAEKKKKEDRLKKEAAAKLAIKPKFYYDVKIECMLPATLTYRVLAEDPMQAMELIKNVQPNSVHHRLIGAKKLVLRVYDAGCSVIKHVKNF